MTEPPEWPPRPTPRRHANEIAQAWLRWVGLSRLLLTAVAVAVVAVGGVWLLRAPAPATEAGLPFATTTPLAVSAPAASTQPPASPVSVTTGDAQPAALVVHVAGAVVAPGVYELPATARIADAVAAAGGPSEDGDLDGINLAAAMIDGQRVHVPVIGEVDPAQVASGAGAGAAAAVAPGATVALEPIDVNSATAADLEQLPGIGPATAAAIVDDRQRNGPFASVDDLDRVPGIGAAKLEAIRASVTA
jgi:competence protein ComEA